LPYAPWYDEGAHHGIECLSCTAWWDDGRQQYMRRQHPVVYWKYRDKLAEIKAAMADDMLLLNKQLVM
jgi:hypothetical protein